MHTSRTLARTPANYVKVYQKEFCYTNGRGCKGLKRVLESREWLAQSFPEVDARTFYRELFPLGCLDKRDAFTEGAYCAIAVQVSENHKARRYTLTDELDNLSDLLCSDLFTVISPMSYAGKKQDAEHQRHCYAIAIDLDGLLNNNGDAVGIRSLFSQIDFGVLLPRPTYVVASSADNVHLYYLLEERIPMWKGNVESLSRYKTQLTSRLWNAYTTSKYLDVQQEPIGQGMRAVGAITKDSKARVRAFRTGDRVSIEYLNKFTNPVEDCQIKVWDSPVKGFKKQRTIPKAKGTKPYFYEWYKKQLPQYTKEGKRYFGLMCLAVVGRKNGVSREQVEQDALALVPFLDSLTVDKTNHFTDEHALKAITAYDKEHFILMKRETLVRLSGVPMEPQKRNGRSQAQHMAVMRAIEGVIYPNGEWRNKDGAPTKQAQVLAYMQEHPGQSVRKMAQALGVSPTTVQKWSRWNKLERETNESAHATDAPSEPMGNER